VKVIPDNTRKKTGKAVVAVECGKHGAESVGSSRSERP
jgi:hypothetical protein